MTTVKANRQGELVLSRELLEAHGIPEGAEVEISGGRKEIVLRLVESNAPSVAAQTLSVEEFLARIPKYSGPPITQEMIDQAIADGAKDRWDRASRVNGNDD
jgi:bifunctional DNA-binding transcriptional regulator/antitoxin component of YhaV-PrlF toxin-antitoxin module